MPTEHTEYEGEVDVPAAAIQIKDPAVIAKLPPGAQVTRIDPHGASFWTRTARLDAEQDGELKEYFLKTSYGDRGKEMMSGEFVAMSAIYNAAPDLAPRPIAWGTYETLADVHFFLCDFHKMTDALPDLGTFPAKMAELHKRGNSPNGKFGFPVTTYHGNTAIEHAWTETWEEYFTVTTKALFEFEQIAQGPNEEIRSLTKPFFAKVVPRLLRPLETGGRSIKPCLIHGDLWHGNATMDAETHLPIIFDAACSYAHNESNQADDLGVWRQTWNRIGKRYVAQYHEHFPASAPEEDQDDRNALYATRVNILDSILYKGYGGYREKSAPLYYAIVSEDSPELTLGRLQVGLKELVDKFPDGIEGWEAQQQLN
ncbi:MAG: hypothetical protein Q9207_001402 [Kuettlingeria erythrocarpa]